MKETGIIFKAEMVRSILSGQKTQTRRVIKPQPKSNATIFDLKKLHPQDAKWVTSPVYCIWPKDEPEPNDPTGRHLDHGVKCPYGRPGDRLWVRETFAWVAGSKNGERFDVTIYRADGNPAPVPWTSPIHMPRRLSRITLEITDIRCQRLQDISTEDAIAEGIIDFGRQDGAPYPHYNIADKSLTTEHDPRAVLFQLWEKINGEGSVADNPWLWCLSFKRIEQPK